MILVENQLFLGGEKKRTQGKVGEEWQKREPLLLEQQAFKFDMKRG